MDADGQKCIFLRNYHFRATKNGIWNIANKRCNVNEMNIKNGKKECNQCGCAKKKPMPALHETIGT